MSFVILFIFSFFFENSILATGTRGKKAVNIAAY